MRYGRRSTPSLAFSVALTSISVSTPNPSFFRASVTFATAASNGPFNWVLNPYMN